MTEATQTDKLPEVSQRLMFEGTPPKDEDVLDITSIGGTLQLISERKGELTHDKCYSILQLKEFVIADSRVDRNLRDAHVEYLINTMKRGTFHPEWVSIITCVCDELNGEEYRMNGQHTCFPPGTRIRMADGSQRSIEQLRLGDQVLSAEGRVRRVMQLHARQYTGEIARVRLWGHGHLHCTPNHKLLTKRGYVPAESLTTDDWVVIPRYASQLATVLLTSSHVQGVRQLSAARNTAWPASSFSTSRPNRKEVPDVIQLDPAFGRLIGLYLAEGCAFQASRNSRIVWTFGIHEEQTLVAETIKLLDRTLGLTARAKLRLKGNSINVTAFGMLWCELFRSLCGTQAGGKRLHPDLLAGPKDFLEAVFWGWMAGDGCRRGARGQYRCGATVSYSLALQMFDIGNFLGLAPSLHRERGSGHNKAPVWKVQVSMESSTHRGCPKIEPSVIWRRVRAIEYKPYDGYVYNIGVEEDNSYVAEGLGVSNCWARVHMPETWPCQVKFLKYRAATTADMRILYSSIDRNAPRTKSNVVNSYLAGTKEFVGASPKIIKLIAEGFCYWMWEEPATRTRHDGDDIAYMLQVQHHGIASRVCKFLITSRIEVKDHKFLRRGPVVGAMYATFDKAPQKAEEFWAVVRDGVGIQSTNDPRMKLRTSLMQTILTSSSYSKGRSNAVSSEEMYRWCLHAWNAWRRGESLRVLRAPMTTPRPVIK